MQKQVNETSKQIVLLIHGIRTRAWWQGEVKGLIEENSGATVIPLKYGYFDVFRFWCPLVICRQGPVARLHKELRDTIREFAGQDISVIAHSFGTYALSRILLEHNDITLRRIVLCGSIIPNSFPWSRIASQISDQPMRDAVLNECGTKDIWPILAASTSWGYGNSGTHGFGSVQVRDRIHAMPHSGYFDQSFVREFWLPFLERGQIVTSDVERAGTSTPWWLSILALPWKWIAVAAVALVIAWSFVPDVPHVEPSTIEQVRTDGDILDTVRELVGGYVNNPRDPNGPTKYGITLQMLTDWRKRPTSIEDVRDLRWEDAKDFYLQRLKSAGYSQINNMPLRGTLFHLAIQNGSMETNKLVQGILNYKFELALPQDGELGSATVQAINSVRDVSELRAAIVCQYVSTLRQHHPNFNDFKTGFIRRAKFLYPSDKDFNC